MVSAWPVSAGGPAARAGFAFLAGPIECPPAVNGQSPEANEEAPGTSNFRSRGRPDSSLEVNMRPSRSGVLILLVAGLLPGCQKDEKGQDASTAPLPEVVVAQVVTRDVTDYGEFTGRTNSTDTVDIRSRVTGY